jgi:hypothetical protein
LGVYELSQTQLIRQMLRNQRGLEHYLAECTRTPTVTVSNSPAWGTRTSRISKTSTQSLSIRSTRIPRPSSGSVLE